ncbi:MAG TPA: alpha/beta hydrolase [Acidimicrobiales bacterium]|nr:alpha/beta hydrolase [Acidimicrobiales bacterium]
MPTAPVDGATLHYEVVGEGPTCLVMSGWPGVDHAYLRPGLDRLGRRLRLVYYDHRCHGRSTCASPDGITIEQLADDAEALAAHVGAEGVLVLGHFHGASVAQELAIRHPRRVRGMILVGATPGERGENESLLDDLEVPPVPVEVDVLQRVPPATDDELAATVRALAPHLFAEDDVTDPEAAFAGATFDARAAGRWMQALGWWSAVDRLAEVDAPALLLVGRHDVLCPPPQSERIGRRLGAAELVVLEGSGHLPWLEESELFAAAVEGWLDRLGL